MSDQPIVMNLEGGTAGHASVTGAPDDEAWIKALSDSQKSVRVRIPAGDDTEGHTASATVDVVVSSDDDDTEGHAISLHFPSVKEANDFRRRATAAGLITATIAIGAAGGVALGTAASDSAQSAGLSSGATAEMQQQHVNAEYGAAATGLSSGAAAELQQQHLQSEYGGGAATAADASARTGPLGDGMNVGGAAQAGSEADAFAGHTQYDAGTGATPQGSSADDEAEPPFVPNRSNPR